MLLNWYYKCDKKMYNLHLKNQKNIVIQSPIKQKNAPVKVRLYQ